MDLTPNELAALAVWDLFHDKCRLWIIFVGSACSRRSRLVRFALKADVRELTAICLLCAKSDRTQRSKKSLLDRIVGAARDFAERALRNIPDSGFSPVLRR